MSTFPYVASGGPLIKTVEQLRKSFPKEVTAETLKKLGLAPKNESYVINVLRFLGAIDDDGKKVPDKAKAFLQVDAAEFRKAMEALVKDAYAELFELHGDAAWTLDRDKLTQFFRNTDHSTDVVGRRQAGTFSHLAALAGHGEMPAPKSQGATNGAKAAVKKPSVPPKAPVKGAGVVAAGTPGGATGQKGSGVDVGLSVRIEVNLPPDGDQETYDRIFRSIRKNLIDGEKA